MFSSRAVPQIEPFLKIGSCKNDPSLKEIQNSSKWSSCVNNQHSLLHYPVTIY